MITKLDQNTNLDIMEKYRVLFDAAFADLKNATDAEGNKLLSDAELQKGKFTDISEYFAHSQDYLFIGKPQYLLLPLDENHFEINANTRAIAIPTEFKNCSGVTTDDMAETITFTIDRYFDFMDLSSLKIDIQWVAPAADGKKKYGVDEIDRALVDLITFNDEGKIRFGWPLSKELTKYPGSIEFSVRFYYEQDGEVSYVLNTLPAMIPIKSSLDINKYAAEGVTVIKNHSNLFNKFVNNYNGPSSGLPTAVSFTIKDLTMEEKIKSDDTLELLVCAYTPDQNPLEYNWYKALDPVDKKEKAIVLESQKTSLTFGDEELTYTKAMPKIGENDTLVLIDTATAALDLESETSRELFNGAYIRYNDSVYKCNIVNLGEEFSAACYKVYVSSIANRQFIDFDDTEGPYEMKTVGREVVLTDTEKASRPFEEFFINVGTEEAPIYERYGFDQPWPPSQKIYRQYNCLYFKPRVDVPENRLEEYNNIAGRYFATATSQKGNNKVIGESTVTTIYEPVDISYDHAQGLNLPDYVFIPQEVDEETKEVTYSPVTLKARINHDEHHPDLTQTCEYFSAKDLGENPSFGNVPEGSSVGIRLDDSKENIEINTTVSGYYRITATSNLNRKEKITTSKICAVYNEPIMPEIDNCSYFVGPKNSPQLDIAEIDSWDNSWGATGESFKTVDAPYQSFVYLKVDPSETFLNNFSTRDVSYNWYVQFADENPFELSSDHVGDNKFLAKNVILNGKVERQNPHNNFIVIDWMSQDTKNVSIYCEIVNTIEGKSESKQTQLIAFV